MKIYNRADFMKLPAGTIFCKGQPWYWEQVSIKGDTLASDFIEMELNSIDASDSSDQEEKYEIMLECGESFPLTDDSYGRDGCFDDKDLFLVYEACDLKLLIRFFESAITQSGDHSK